jgi:hypothetical protein
MNVDRAKLKRNSGVLLIECLIYMVIFVILAGLALACFYVAWNNHRDLARNARYILNATEVGEQWREDVRHADRAVQVDPAGISMTIPRGASAIVYRWDENKMVRTEGTNATVTLLESVRSSRLLEVKGRQVRAWRWELELATPQKAARVAPHFVFTAVPGAT